MDDRPSRTMPLLDQIKHDRAERWEIGVAARDDPDRWRGFPPLLWAYEETLDLLNYLDAEIAKRSKANTPQRSLRAMRALGQSLAVGLLRELQRADAELLEGLDLTDLLEPAPQHVCQEPEFVPESDDVCPACFYIDETAP